MTSQYGQLLKTQMWHLLVIAPHIFTMTMSFSLQVLLDGWFRGRPHPQANEPGLHVRLFGQLKMFGVVLGFIPSARYSLMLVRRFFQNSRQVNNPSFSGVSPFLTEAEVFNCPSRTARICEAFYSFARHSRDNLQYVSRSAFTLFAYPIYVIYQVTD